MTNKQLTYNLSSILKVSAKNIEKSNNVTTTLNIVAEAMEVINAALNAVKQGRN